jgi:hypothetical protein
MSVSVFIQDHGGDYNFDYDFDTRILARKFVGFVLSSGGYWSGSTPQWHAGIMDGNFSWEGTGDVFIPLHRIDRFELTEHEDEK